MPITGSKCVDLIITEKGVFEVDKRNGLTLIEIAEGVTLDNLRATTGCDFKVKQKVFFNLLKKSLLLLFFQFCRLQII